jgi:hypothetical protein
VEGCDPDAVGLELAQTLRADPLGGHAIRCSSPLELVEAAELAVFRGDDDLATDLVRDSGLVAEVKELLTSARTEACLQGARCVVDAAVNDAAAPTRLMESRTRLLLHHEYRPAGAPLRKLPGAGEADDSGSDDDSVGAAGEAGR